MNTTRRDCDSSDVPLLCQQWSEARDPVLTAASAASSTEAPTAPPLTRTEPIALPLDLLDGGEIIILAIKPSLWFVLFDSIKWIVAAAVVIGGWALAGNTWARFSDTLAAQLTLLVVATRLGVAVLRWVSRFYVLTNRRVMRIRGVLRPDVRDILLPRVINTRLTQALHEKITGLGTLHFAADKPLPSDCAWRNIARPEEVHAEVRRAIERALDHHPV